MAPEIFQTERGKILYGKSIDVWAAGVTLFLLLTNEFPFNAKTLPEITSQICKEEPKYDLIENSEIKALLKAILEKDPVKRIQTIDIIENNWLTKNG